MLLKRYEFTSGNVTGFLYYRHCWLGIKDYEGIMKKIKFSKVVLS